MRSLHSVTLAGPSLLLALHLAAGCGPDQAAPSGSAAPSATGATKSADAAASRPGAASSSARATAASAVPALPDEPEGSASARASGPPPRPPVTSCEPVAGHFGGFTPTVDELVAAAKALPSDVCVPRAKLEDAIRDCAANIGGTAFAIFVDDGGERGCHVAVEGGAHQDRKFVVFVGGFRIGATFDAGSTAIELGASPHVYLDSLGKDAELCPMTSSGGKATKSKPDGWDGLPADVRDFLCSGTPEK